MKRKLPALILALLLCQGLIVPALAVVDEIAAVKVDDVMGYSQSDGVYTVIQDGLYGFYHADGTELTAAKFAYAEEFQDGMAVVSPKGSPERYGYINLDGRMAVSVRYSRAFPFAQDRAFAVREHGGALVLLDRGGRELAVFRNARLQPGDRIQFSEGLAVIPIQEIAEDGEDVPLVYLVVDLEGEEVCTLTDAYVDYGNGYHDGRIAVSEAGEWVEAGDGSYRRFQAKAGSWGYRDAAGELAEDYQYDEAAPFSEGIAAVGRREGEDRVLYGFIDTEGGEILPLEYGGFVSFVNGSGAVLGENGLWAYVDDAGQLLTGFYFDAVSSFAEDAARVRIGSRRMVVDRSGDVLFTAGGENILPCSGGVFPVQDEAGLWGVYSRSGELLVDFTYDRAFHWDGFLWLKRGDLWRVYLTEDVIADRAAAAEADGTPVAAVGAFSDVPPDAYYAQAVTWATDSDIVTGTGGGQFSPERPCTTGEIVMCLWRAAGQPEPTVENPFENVSPSHYYYQAALWAYETGLTGGETFSAAEPCTRAMVVAYLWSMDGRPFALTNVFADVPEDAAYAQAVAWAVERGITEGSTDGLFEPDSICSRGQIVTFLYRYMEG